MDLLTLSLVIFISLATYLKFCKRCRLNLPPSPPKLPLIGNLHQLGNLPHRALTSLSKKYGPLMLLHFGRTPTLVISSGEIFAEITKNHDTIFSEKPRGKVHDIFFFNCTDVVFSSYNDYWKRARKICVSELLSQKRVQSFQYVREEVVASAMEKLRTLAMQKTAVNLTDMFGRMSNDVISRTALGRSFDDGHGEMKFGEPIKRMMQCIAKPSYADISPFLGWMDMLTGFDRKIDYTTKNLHGLLDQVIKEHQILASDGGLFGNGDLADIMLHLRRDGVLDFDFTHNNIKAVLLDMFAAGIETSSTVLEWTMAELAINPSIIKKAQEEVRKILGNKKRIEEADVHKLDYLKCIIKESMRLHCPAIALRGTSCDVKVGGYDIPARTNVWVNLWAISRDPKVWDRPEEFLPERFIDSTVDFKGQHSQFIPFGIGRRGCPGMSFAMATVECVLANFLYWFDWDLGSEPLDMTERFAIAIRKKEPLYLVPTLHSP